MTNFSYHAMLPKKMTADAQNLKDSYIARHQSLYNIELFDTLLKPTTYPTVFKIIEIT